MSMTCDECGKEMSDADLRQQRFRRGKVEIIVRAHFMARAIQNSRVCRACVVRAVNETDADAPQVTPPGMFELRPTKVDEGPPVEP